MVSLAVSHLNQNDTTMTDTLKQVDAVTILTLQDNSIDLVAGDNSDVVQRARPMNGNVFGKSIVAEHGFSTLITITKGEQQRQLLFDFGLSPDGAARNAQVLEQSLSQVEQLVLSHGHLDHLGGLAALVEAVGPKKLELVLHPAALDNKRYRQQANGTRMYIPSLASQLVEELGLQLCTSKAPLPVLAGHGLFLGEVERWSPFDKGSPGLYTEQDGQEQPDSFADDSGLIFHVEGKGLVLITGCAHSGIVNMVRHAQKVSGVQEIYAIMGGFHLSGADFEQVIVPTGQALQEIAPRYIIPTHCSGRLAMHHFETTMPDAFLLNMAGTTLTFRC